MNKVVFATRSFTFLYESSGNLCLVYKYQRMHAF